MRVGKVARHTLGQAPAKEELGEHEGTLTKSLITSGWPTSLRRYTGDAAVAASVPFPKARSWVLALQVLEPGDLSCIVANLMFARITALTRLQRARVVLVGSFFFDVSFLLRLCLVPFCSIGAPESEKEGHLGVLQMAHKMQPKTTSPSMSSNEELMRVQCHRSKLNGLSRAEGQEGEGRAGAKLWKTSNSQLRQHKFGLLGVSDTDFLGVTAGQRRTVMSLVILLTASTFTYNPIHPLGPHELACDVRSWEVAYSSSIS